jgi:eukaryotic-like serine/threonine-protein kinase
MESPEPYATESSRSSASASGDASTIAPGLKPCREDAAVLPKTIGSYRILGLLGEGGMGAVYEAEQDQPRRLVALKVIRSAWASPQTLRRFEQESQALGRLQHPGIAQIYEAGSAETGFGVQPFFAMELIHGKPLVEYADEQKLNMRQRLELMIQICDAVHHAHQRGIIHRDLKPSNILVDEAGQPKILDFGLARATDSDAQATRQTDMGQLLGTLAYMSPEQVLADPLALDTRSDVYALGVILYELLAGKLPYMLSKLLHEAVKTIQQTDPAPLSSIHRNYRGDIETIVAKALEKDKARRYASAAELAADIRRYLNDEPIVARPPSAGYQLAKFARRNKALVGGVSAVFVVLVLGIVASTREAIQARRAQGSAQQETAIAQAVNDFLQNDLLAQASAYNQLKPDPDLKVRTALDRAAQNIGGKFKSQPEVEAAIRKTIGETFDDLGLYPEAAAQLQSALQLSRRASGAENPTTLSIQADLASVDEKQGKYAETEKLASQAVAADRKVFGTDDPRTLRAMDYLASAYGDEDKIAQAVALHQQVIEADRRRLGPDDPTTLASMDDLANTYINGEDYAKAEAMARQVVDARRRAPHLDAPQFTASLQNLAAALTGEGKFADADAVYDEELELDRRIFGPEHAKTLLVMQSLAWNHIYEGKYQDAESQLHRILDADRRVLGPDNPDTFGTLEALAMASDLAGNHAEAVATQSQLLGAYRKLYGPDHSKTLSAMGNLAWFNYERGDYADAERVDRQMLAATQRLFGPDNANTVNAGGNLADVLAAEGKYTEAEALYMQTLQTARRSLGDSHLYTLDVLYRIPEMYQREGKYALAEKYAGEALAARRKAQGADDPKTLISECDLALALVSEGKYAQAEPLAREAMELEKKTQPDQWERYRSESLLGASLAGEKRPSEAAPLLEEGYHGMLARKAHINAPDRWQLDLAHQWLVRFGSSGTNRLQINSTVGVF